MQRVKISGAAEFFRRLVKGARVDMDEFLGANGRERVRRCRQLADEADALATDAINLESRKAYLDLKRR